MSKLFEQKVYGFLEESAERLDAVIKDKLINMAGYRDGYATLARTSMSKASIWIKLQNPTQASILETEGNIFLQLSETAQKAQKAFEEASLLEIPMVSLEYLKKEQQLLTRLLDNRQRMIENTRTVAEILIAPSSTNIVTRGARQVNEK